MSDLRKDVDEMISRLRALSRQAPPVAEPQSPSDVAEQVRALRAEYGLPEPSLAERLASRGVPKRCAEMILAGKVADTIATGFAWALTEGQGIFLVLAGKQGRGKTLAAANMLSRRPGLFVECAGLAKPPPPREDVTIGEDDQTQDSALDVRMRTTPLLIVDDVGKEHSPGGYAAKRLASILTHRWEWMKPTLLTTNLTPEDFAARYGAHIASRINEEAKLGWHELGGPDLRVRS